MIDTEQMMRAACINRDAASDFRQTVGEFTQSVRDLRAMIDPGYGNQFSELLELLRKIPDNGVWEIRKGST